MILHLEASNAALFIAFITKGRLAANCCGDDTCCKARSQEMSFRNFVLHCGRDVEKAGVSDGLNSQQGWPSTTQGRYRRGLQTCKPADRPDKGFVDC